MSKTKEEILQHHYIHDKGLVNPVLYVHNSMDEWAQQKVDDFKETIASELDIRAQMILANQTAEEIDYGYFKALIDIKKLILKP